MTRRQAKKLMKRVRSKHGASLSAFPWRARTEERLYYKLRRAFAMWAADGSPLPPWYACNRLCSRAFRAHALRKHRRQRGFGSSPNQPRR